jgi:hypothetical protein
MPQRYGGVLTIIVNAFFVAKNKQTKKSQQQSFVLLGQK